MKKSTMSFFNVLLGCSLSGIMSSAYSLTDGDQLSVSLIYPTEKSANISGYRGDTFVTGGADSSTHAIYGISSKERSDNPCLVTALKENINDSNNDTTPTKNLCGPNGATSSELKVAYGDSGLVGGTRAFVTGIRVCMNNRRTRVKGFRLRGKKISNTGNLEDLDAGKNGITEPQSTRANCDEKDGWMTWAECPDNKLATAAILHFEAGNKPRSLVGIELKCRAIKVGISTSS